MIRVHQIQQGLLDKNLEADEEPDEDVLNTL
jgi:hypothetical protein